MEKLKISIHAPAKGATKSVQLPFSLLEISIHAPAKGATCPNVRYCNGLLDFNPRSREGSDCFGFYASFKQ